MLETEVGSKEAKVEEMQEEIAKLKQDLDQSVVAAGAGTGRNSWEGSIGRGSWGSDHRRGADKEIEEHLKHVRSIMIQFLSKLPVTTKENEDILPIIYSMLNFPQTDIDAITAARDKLNSQASKKKGGLLAGFKKTGK